MLKYLLCACLLVATTASEKEWKGNWFPGPPENSTASTSTTTSGAEPATDKHGRVQMGVENPDCDDAQRNLAIDFDPNDIRYATVSMCLDNRHEYRGDYNMEPLITLSNVPDAYVALHRCMDQPIEYEERIPTFGTHRPLWPRYGEYEFVPPQRWLHNSEHGAVIALYHPCANKQQIDEFRQIVKSCLYRHVITPSDLPSRDRPFALVTWHAKLEFSVLERTVVEDFIRAYSLKGPEQTSRDGQYDHLLVEPAAVVSTRDDEVLCPKHKRRD